MTCTFHYHKYSCVCAQSCPTLCDPTDWSPPGSSVPGLFQARILEWAVIPFSGDLPNLGIQSVSPASSVLAGGFSIMVPPGKPLPHAVIGCKYISFEFMKSVWDWKSCFLLIGQLQTSSLNCPFLSFVTLLKTTPFSETFSSSEFLSVFSWLF